MCVQESHRHRSWQHIVSSYLVTCMYVWMYSLGSGEHVVAFVHKSTMVLLTDVSVLSLLSSARQVTHAEMCSLSECI